MQSKVGCVLSVVKMMGASPVNFLVAGLCFAGAGLSSSRAALMIHTPVGDDTKTFATGYLLCRSHSMCC